MTTSIVRLGLALAAFLLAAPQGHAADAVTDFYKGKNVYLHIGSGTGGGYDALGRVVARHIGKHIPGTPNVVVQNIPGGGSLAMANQFGNTTARDGTVFGLMNNGAPTTPLLTPSAAHYDARKFSFLGSPSREVQILVVWHTAPVKTIEETFTKELIVGASAPGGAPYDYALLTNAILGTKFKIITGYSGGGETKLAMQRGEIHANAALGWAAAKAEYMDLIDKKELLIVAQYGFKNHHELTHLPLFPLGKNDEERQLFQLMYSRQDYGRPFAMPPEVPADRVAAMRKAFEDTMKDPGFVAEMNKLNLEIDPVTWQELQELTNAVYNTPASVQKRMQDVLNSAKKQ